jgi:hypothetical protein
MKTVYKYQLHQSTQFVLMPRHAKILSFHSQHGEPCVWALVDTDEPTVDATEIRIHGTGHDVGNLKGFRFIGTCLGFADTLVLHAWANDGGVGA